MRKIDKMIRTLESGISENCNVPHLFQIIDISALSAKRQEACGQMCGEGVMNVAQEIDYLKATSFIAANRPIYSCRKTFGPVIVLSKKVIRKLIKFYVEPITVDQSDRNAHITRTLEMMEGQILDQEEEIARRKAGISARNAKRQVCSGGSKSIAQEINYLKETSFVSANRPILNCRKVIGPVIVFLKRAIRRMMRFYIEPITLDQSDRNAHFARALEMMEAQILNQEEELIRGKPGMGARAEGVMDIRQEIEYLKATSFVPAYRPILGCHKIVGPIIVFFKKVIRKMTKFYVEPIMLDQSDRNAHIARTMEMMELQILSQAEEIVRLESDKR